MCVCECRPNFNKRDMEDLCLNGKLTPVDFFEVKIP